MKKTITFFVSLGAVFLPAALLAASPLRGTVVQGDDFSTNATLIEKWDKKNNVEIKDGKLYLNQGSLSPRHELPEEYYMAFDMVSLNDAKNFPNGGGFFIIGADDGVLALIRPNGGHQLLMPNPDNPQKRVGGGKSLKPVPGQPLRVEFSRQKGSEGLYRYTLIINDQIIHQLSSKAKAKPIVSFGQWRAEAVLDNMEFCTIKQGQTSPNLVINSSLEHLQENFNPQYFTLGLSRNYKNNPSFEDFAPCLNPDDKVAHSGKRSFRLQNKAPLATGALVGTSDIGVIKGQPMTFSVYLKASKADTPARLTIRGMWGKQFHKDVKVGTDWQRYSFTESPENSLIRCNVVNTAKDNAIVWADDFQCELGAKLTPYAPCTIDDVKLGLKKVEYAPIPPIKPTKFAKAPVFDGKLEDWATGAKVDSFTVLKPDSRPAPKHKTEAFFGYDKDNLYIGVRAYVGDLAKVKADELQRDNTNIVTQNDCVELYIDRGPTRKEMFWLAANSAGSQLDAAPGDRLNWNGNWRIAASQNKKLNALEYEFAIPLSELSGANLSETFGINIGRTTPADGESCDITTTPRRMFKVPEVFPQLILPREAVRPYALGVHSATLSNAVDRKNGVNIEIAFVNNSGAKKEMQFTVNEAKNGTKLASFDASLPPGETVLTMPVSISSPAAPQSVVIEGREKGKMILSAFERAAIVNAVTVLPRFDYYMNEPAADVLVEMKLPSADGVKAVLSCGKFSKSIPVSKRQIVEVPLAGLPDGKNAVQLKLTGGNLDYTVSVPLVRKPYFKGATQIDRIRLCVVNDSKPILPVAPLICVNQRWRQTVETVIPEIRFHQKYGFSDFIILIEGDDNYVADGTKKLNELGIKMILWTKALTKGVERQPDGKWVRTNYDPKPLMEKLCLPGVIAIMPWDEPEISGLKSEDCAWTMGKVNAAKTYQPTAINYTVIGIPARYANLDADIIGIDDYITNNDKRDAESVLAYVRRVMDACRAERKVGYFFTAGEVYGNHYRCPTYAEQIALNYGSITAGITGMEYFYALPINPGNWRAMVQIAREFKTLTPVVCTREEVSEAQISDSAVKFITRRLNGKLYVIAVNTENRPAKGVGVTLPGELKYAPKVEVLFDNRSISQSGGRFQDDFEPYSRRVYCVNID